MTCEMANARLGYRLQLEPPCTITYNLRFVRPESESGRLQIKCLFEEKAIWLITA
jgi:hypothetical protein